MGFKKAFQIVDDFTSDFEVTELGKPRLYSWYFALNHSLKRY